MRLKVENEEKKNVIEIETWSHPERNIGVDIETGYRFATYIIDIDEEDEPLEAENPVGTIITDYNIEEMEASDSFSFSFTEVFKTDGTEPLTEEEQDAIISELESLFDEGGFSAMEDAGWGHHNTETFIYGPLIIEEAE